jgi:VanZ family protein
VVLVGLNRLFPTKSRGLNILLFSAYLAGILFMGLRPRFNLPDDCNNMLDPNFYDTFDFITNIFGFIPLGYLMMRCLLSLNRSLKKISASVIVFVACLSITLFIEISQYYIPGRISQLYDVVSNGIGALVGIAFYFYEHRAPQTG